MKLSHNLYVLILFFVYSNRSFAVHFFRNTQYLKQTDGYYKFAAICMYIYKYVVHLNFNSLIFLRADKCLKVVFFFIPKLCKITLSFLAAKHEKPVCSRVPFYYVYNSYERQCWKISYISLIFDHLLLLFFFK